MYRIGPRFRHTRTVLARWLGLEGFDHPAHDGFVVAALAIAVVAVVLRLFFWWYTRRTWEDTLISVLHSENVVRGLGMTHYRTGQAPLHGFTSPLSVLVPLIGDLLHCGFGLDFIKLVSAFAGGLTVLYAAAFTMHPKVRIPTSLSLMSLGYLACEHHQILFGMSGMETQLVTLALFMSIYYAVTMRPVSLGVSLGLCMLARPDLAFWTAIVGTCVLLFHARHLPKTVLVAVAVYGPWVLFTCAYYGSPVPNTILAKGTAHSLWSNAYTVGTVLRHVVGRVFAPLCYPGESIFLMLAPSFCGHGSTYSVLIDEYGVIRIAMVLLACVGAGASVVRRQWTFLPLTGFFLVYTVYFVFVVAVVFPWYLVPFCAATIMLSVKGIQTVGELVSRPARRTIGFACIGVVYVSIFLAVLPVTFTAERRIQRDIENPVRRALGLYLHDVMGLDQSVGGESLGYVSYYSKRTVYDWPGLANRRVVEYSKAHPEGRNLIAMLEYFRPDYLVLRFSEYESSPDARWIDDEYCIVASFEADRARLRQVFRWQANIDTGFVVLTRRPAPLEPGGPACGHFRIPQNQIGALTTIGIRLANQGKIQEAVRYFEQALAADPAFTSALCGLGLAKAQSGDRKAGEACFRKALEVDPQCVVAYVNLRAANAENKDADAATKYFQGVLSVNPYDDLARYNLAITLGQMGNMKDAIRQFSRLVWLCPNYRTAFADALVAAHRPREAIRQYRTCAALAPDNAEIWLRLGALLLAENEPDEALDCCERAARLAPNSAKAHEGLGNALATLGRYDEALASYAKALKQGRDSPALRRNVNRAMEAQALRRK